MAMRGLAAPKPRRDTESGLAAEVDWAEELRRGCDAFGGRVTLGVAVKGRVAREPFGDANDLGAERSQLQFDTVIVEAPVLVEHTGGGGDGTTYGTAHARSARTENSIVLIACNP